MNSEGCKTFGPQPSVEEEHPRLRELSVGRLWEETVLGLSEEQLCPQNRQQRKEHLEMKLETDQGPVQVRHEEPF